MLQGALAEELTRVGVLAHRRELLRASELVERGVESRLHRAALDEVGGFLRLERREDRVVRGEGRRGGRTRGTARTPSRGRRAGPGWHLAYVWIASSPGLRSEVDAEATARLATEAARVVRMETRVPTRAVACEARVGADMLARGSVTLRGTIARAFVEMSPRGARTASLEVSSQRRGARRFERGCPRPARDAAAPWPSRWTRSNPPAIAPRSLARGNVRRLRPVAVGLARVGEEGTSAIVRSPSRTPGEHGRDRTGDPRAPALPGRLPPSPARQRPQLLHRRARRPRQVDARRPPARDHRAIPPGGRKQYLDRLPVERARGSRSRRRASPCSTRTSARGRRTC